MNTLDIKVKIENPRYDAPLYLCLKEVTDNKIKILKGDKFLPSFSTPDILAGVIQALEEKGLSENDAKTLIFNDLNNQYGFDIAESIFKYCKELNESYESHRVMSGTGMVREMIKSMTGKDIDTETTLEEQLDQLIQDINSDKGNKDLKTDNPDLGEVWNNW
ncbi:MAG: hypothetical protein ABI721_01670 [Candidatus Dojkabacteria bacterium]